MFFEYFPTTTYKITEKEQIIVTDFIRAIKLDPILKTDSLFFTVYTAQDDETPEIISHKFYKSTAYHWIIMLLNEKFDPFTDFPKSSGVIKKYSELKYGDADGIHHYENADGRIVDELTEVKIPITNFEYETRVNEELRPTKILKSEFLSEFVNQYRGLIDVTP